jgi:hypothetical protein
MNFNPAPLKALLSVSFFLLCCSGKREQTIPVNFPSHIYLEKISPDQKTKAIIYSWTNSEQDNLLGSEDRFILGFSKSNVKWYIDFELSEGFGTYEGGILEIRWINNNEVLIKRTINDSRKDIKYNLADNKWTLVN